jgi:hypothetical protein
MYGWEYELDLMNMNRLGFEICLKISRNVSEFLKLNAARNTKPSMRT